MVQHLKPVIRLEIGARSDHWPAGDYLISPYAANEFPELFRQSETPVRSLAAERTFWDKVVILHAEHHRPQPAKPIARLSRHYYDVARLCESTIGANALGNLPLLKAVIEHQLLFFPRAWAHYEKALPGTLRIMPHAARVKELEQDYRTMAGFFFGEAPPFAYILEILDNLESKINRV